MRLAVATSPPSATVPLVIVPPDSPQTKQLRVQPVRAQAMPVEEVAAPARVIINPNRIARVLPPVQGRVVTVLVKRTDGSRIFVVGKVNHPGDFPLNRPVDVMQALSLAGGATPYADVNGIKILRRDGTRQEAFPFRYDDVRRGKDLAQNILLRSGDTVVVP